MQNRLVTRVIVVRMKVSIDDERCEGHGRCYAIAPEVFQPDDIGNAVVVEDGNIAPEHEEKARLAMANCPERAVSIEESP